MATFSNSSLFTKIAICGFVSLNLMVICHLFSDSGSSSVIPYNDSISYGSHDTITSNDSSTDYKDYIISLKEALKPENRNITFIVNSCGRIDLLHKSMKSFSNSIFGSTYTINNRIMVEDCCKRQAKQCTDILQNYNNEFNIIFTAKNNNFARDHSIMNAVELGHLPVNTPWIYHAEDDWEFIPNSSLGFDVIEMSFRVFESHLYNLQDENFINPNNEWYNKNVKQNESINNVFKYSSVVCTNMHVMDHDKMLKSKLNNDTSWYEVTPTWTGFSFNAGLHPTFIYRQIVKSFLDYKGETPLTVLMHQKGFGYAAVYPQQCKHIGRGRHVNKK